MATNDTPETGSESQDETSEDQQQDTSQDSTDETSGQEQQSDTQQDASQEDPTKGLKSALQGARADLNKERKDHKATTARVAELEAQVKDLTPKAETTDAIQSRYDRLEAFLQALPGPLGKALDSKSFTKRLFESEDKVSDIIKDWNKANPTATASALGGGTGATSEKKSNMNDLLRAAARG
ncbi:scaffolding protein [Microbacterium phage Quartz]|nr:scaffolding protein [Microbacterium phage Quartz]